MKIDRAAAAFHAAKDNYVVLETVHGFTVQEVDGTVHVLGRPTQEDAEALMQQLADRDGVEAVLREMISPAVLHNAAHLAGIDLRKFENNQINMGCKPSLALLKGIIALLEREAA